MKIIAIETLVCHARMRNWIFVKVVTDQPGLIGWGEATLEWHTRSIVGAIEDMSHLLIGEDPTRVEYLWQVMYRQHFWHGHGIVRATAIAGIDLALLPWLAAVPVPYRRHFDHEQALRDLDSGLSTREVAARHKVHPQTVNRVRRDRRAQG